MQVLAASAHGPVEPATLFLEADPHGSILGRLVAPLTVPGSCLEIALRRRFARARVPLVLELRLLPTAPVAAHDSPSALHYALVALASAVSVEAVFEPPGASALADPARLRYVTAIDAAHRCVLAYVFPPSAGTADRKSFADSAVVIFGVAVSGTPVLPTSSLPLRVPFRPEIRIPQVLRQPLPGCNHPCVAVTAHGELLVPTNSPLHIFAYGPDGESLPPLCLPQGEDAKISQQGPSAIAVDSAVGVILVGDHNGEGTRLVAVDSETGAVRWALTSGEVHDCRGIAVMSRHGVAVVGSNSRRSFLVVRVADGSVLATMRCDGFVNYVAADDSSGAIFVCVDSSVWAFSWDGTRARLRDRGMIDSAEYDRDPDYGSASMGWMGRPLAIVPQELPDGESTAHLVVATWNRRVLLVLDITSFALLRKVKLARSIQVQALAADPHGDALVVVSKDEAVHAIRWPPPT